MTTNETDPGLATPPQPLPGGPFETSFVDDAAGLTALCDELAGSPWLALDTEFLRERTYYARLCLVQVAAPGRIACIDPLAIGDLAPLARLLEGPQRKILHAARQDFEVFLQGMGILPGPLFDTQLAAAFCGHGDQVSYAALVSEVAGVDLPKGHTRTDWSRRPLSAEQLEYARSDVEFLPLLQQHFSRRLKALGRTGWFEEECRQLTNPALYEQLPETAWRRLKGGAGLPPRSQQAARRLGAWREECAQARDIPREWVLRSSVLLEIARRLPDSLRALGEVKDLHPKTLQRSGRALLERVAGEGDTAEPLWDDAEPLGGAERKLMKRLMKRLQERAAEERIAPALIANRRMLEQLVRGRRDLPLLEGWRKEVVGSELLEMVEGG